MSASAADNCGIPTLVLSPVQVDHVMAQPDVSGLTGARDRATLEVLYSTGMRRMELMQLGISDIDLEGRTVMIRQGKGRRDRYIPVGERACYWVGRYLDEERPALVVRSDEWTMFLTDYGEPFGKNRLTDLVKRYMELAGIREERATRCATRARRTCWKTERTCGSSRRCWGTQTCRARRSIRRWRSASSRRCTRPRTRRS